MLTAWLSDESAIIWFVWWWIGDHILCGPCSLPPSHPHTPPRISASPRPPGGWLTFDGWQAGGSRCRRGTSSAWFHSASPPPSNLVNNIKCWSGIINVSVWMAATCALPVPAQTLSLTHAHNALLFIWFNSPSHMLAHFTPPSSPLISLVNLTRCESVRGRGCSSMLWMSSTSHMNWMTGWAL